MQLLLTLALTLTFLTLLCAVIAVALKWETLRTAYNLAESHEKTRKLVEDLSHEWADTLDILRAREERERKRASRAIRVGAEGAPQAEQSATPAAAAAGGIAKQRELWARVRARGAASASAGS